MAGAYCHASLFIIRPENAENSDGWDANRRKIERDPKERLQVRDVVEYVGNTELGEFLLCGGPSAS